MLETENLTVDVLAPSKEDASAYINMLEEVAAGYRKKIEGRIVNSASAVLRIRHARNTVLLGGDAPSEVWEQITGRVRGVAPRPLGIQCVKASHHGSSDSFYPELWDDLFGEREGTVLISANGTTRPTRQFLESFEDRRKRGICDAIFITRALDPEKRPEFMDLEYQAVLDWLSHAVKDSGIEKWGDITSTVSASGSVDVTQPHAVPV